MKTSAQLGIALALGTSAARSSAFRLAKRDIQTDAVCDSSFSWAANSKQQSPCLVAAYVAGACGTNTYQVTKLANNNRYDAPNSTTANACTCSWSSYNLLSACTACQNQPNSIPTWDAWIYQCTNYISTSSYFPQGITLPDGTSIPYYASTNPTSWPNHQFNVNQAKSSSAEGHPDLNPNPSKEKSKVPLGPLIGGVVGGVLLIALCIILILCVRKRRRSDARPYTQPTAATFIASPTPVNPAVLQADLLHNRSMSEMSRKSLHSYTPGTATTFSPISPPSLIMTHLSPATTQYANSLPAFGGSLHGHSSSLGHSASYSSTHGHGVSPSSPTPSHRPLSQHQPQGGQDFLSAENIIEPFLLEAAPTAHVRHGSRPTEKGGSIPMYDNPTRPPGIPPSDAGPSVEPPTTPRRRLNPPAYTPTDPASPMSAAQHLASSNISPPAHAAGPSTNTSPSAWSDRVDQKLRRWKSAASTERSQQANSSARRSSPGLPVPSIDLTRSLSVGSAFPFPQQGTPDLSENNVLPANLSRATSASTMDRVLEDMGFEMPENDSNRNSLGNYTVATGFSRQLGDDPPPAFR